MEIPDMIVTQMAGAALDCVFKEDPRARSYSNCLTMSRMRDTELKVIVKTTREEFVHVGREVLSDLDEYH